MKAKGRKFKKKGETLILLLTIIFLFSLMMLPIIDILFLKTKVLNFTVRKELSLQIAEAGINYYQWHLAHFPTDYQDGTGQPGPYNHLYFDLNTQTKVGEYRLTITPPSVGSTIVTIQSTGWTQDPSITRTITARYGIPSLAQYSFLSNDVIWIGPDETVSGQMQSNNGIRFDGIGNAPIQSARSTYTCPSSQGSPCPATKNGVWGGASQAVKNFWQFPVPAVDFSTLTSNLASLKSLGQASGGIYLPPSNAQGYSLVFKSNSTIDIYKVTSRTSNPTGWDVNSNPHNEYTDYNARTLLYNKPMPTNGIVYIEDNTWVEGTVKGRVMVAAAKLPYNPSTSPTIYIPNNIVYQAKDGTNVLGLLSQKDVIVTYHAPNTLEVNAALIAQNGSAQFLYYPNNIKTSITVYGSTMSYGQWTWTWVNGSGNVLSGYVQTNNTYDGNLLFGPPPSFPLSTSGYQLLSQSSN